MKRYSLRRILPLMHKERLQIRRDPRTLGMMIMIPALWLLLFGYAATFDVKDFRAVLMDEVDSASTEQLIQELEVEGFDFFEEAESTEAVRDALKLDEATAGLTIEEQGDGDQPRVTLFVDGSKMMTAQGAIRAAQQAAQELSSNLPPAAVRPDAQPLTPRIDVLFNPDLRSADFMIPGLLGLVLIFIGGLMTSLGIVRERERGTLEQLIVTPLRPLELVLGKILPYAVLAFFDLVVVLLLGIYVFDVPFRGNLVIFLVISSFFLLGALGVGLLISTVSQNQQQAMQAAVFYLFPQILLSGLVFPLEAIPLAVRWVSYTLPLTYFVPIARGMFLKDATLASLWQETLVLVIFAVVVLIVAAVRFRRRLA